MLSLPGEIRKQGDSQSDSKIVKESVSYMIVKGSDSGKWQNISDHHLFCLRRALRLLAYLLQIQQIYLVAVGVIVAKQVG